MTKQDYKEKLIAFNSTDKYKSEMEFARQLLEPSEGDVILDYGCGIGTFVDHLKHTSDAKVLGHDTQNYFEDQPEWFRESIYFPVDKVSFIHSFAHIEEPEIVLSNLYERMYKGGRIVVITPNAQWLGMKRTPDYIPDPTVHEHYDCQDLVIMFGQAGFKVKTVGQFGAITYGINERTFLVAVK